MWNLKYDTNELIYKTETDSWTSMGFSRQEYWSGVPLPSLIQMIAYDICLPLSYFT